MKAQELFHALTRTLGTSSTKELATRLGLTVQTLRNWKNQSKALTSRQLAAAIVKARDAAVKQAQSRTIQPIVEFYGIDPVATKRDAGWEVFGTSEGATTYALGLKKALKTVHGIYIFYDSRGRSLYVGKACEQSIWREMNLAFNRQRDVQSIRLVHHPDRNQTFQAGYEKLRQPKYRHLQLFDLAAYFSAYQVDGGMINNLEALMVRAFANDSLNVKMEKFTGRGK